MFNLPCCVFTWTERTGATAPPRFRGLETLQICQEFFFLFGWNICWYLSSVFPPSLSPLNFSVGFGFEVFSALTLLFSLIYFIVIVIILILSSCFFCLQEDFTQRGECACSGETKTWIIVFPHWPQNCSNKLVDSNGDRILFANTKLLIPNRTLYQFEEPNEFMFKMCDVVLLGASASAGEFVKNHAACRTKRQKTCLEKHLFSSDLQVKANKMQRLCSKHVCIRHVSDTLLSSIIYLLQCRQNQTSETCDFSYIVSGPCSGETAALLVLQWRQKPCESSSKTLKSGWVLCVHFQSRKHNLYWGFHTEDAASQFWRDARNRLQLVPHISIVKKWRLTTSAVIFGMSQNLWAVRFETKSLGSFYCT